MSNPIPHDIAVLHNAHQSNEALSGTYAIASVGIAMLTMLETLLPAAAGEVERESLAITDHFMTLAAYMEQQEKPPENVMRAIHGIIIGMQFQDRNTQIMDNVAGMLERYRSMLEDVCGNIEAVRKGEVSPEGELASSAVQSILSSIRLSEIRSRYLQALSKTKVPSPAELLDTPPETPVGDIDLF